MSNPIRPKMDEILVKALRANPQNRYQSAREMQNELKEVIFSAGLTALTIHPNEALTVDKSAFRFMAESFAEAIKRSNLPPRRRPFLSPALPPQGIFGREKVFTEIRDLLQIEDATARDVQPVALVGMGGIGKTTLTTGLSRLEFVPKFFPDGVLWVELGIKPIVRSLLQGWGHELDIDLTGETNEKTCAMRLSSELHDRRLLIIVDDVWQTREGKAFAVGGSGSRTVFTTREMDIAFDLATQGRTLKVELLSPEASLALLNQLAPLASKTDAAKTKRLCERLEYLPLGLTLAGRLLALESELGDAHLVKVMAELIEQGYRRIDLKDSEGRSYLPEGQPASLWDILGRSVDRLSLIDKERFAMSSTFGGEPLTWELADAASVWECSAEEAISTTRELIRRGLVARHGNRFWMHMLLADYGRLLRHEMKL